MNLRRAVIVRECSNSHSVHFNAMVMAKRSQWFAWFGVLVFWGTMTAGTPEFNCLCGSLKERLQKKDKGGHIILESIIFSLQYKAGPQGALLNPEGGARFAIDRR